MDVRGKLNESDSTADNPPRRKNKRDDYGGRMFNGSKKRSYFGVESMLLLLGLTASLIFLPLVLPPLPPPPLTLLLLPILILAVLVLLPVMPSRDAASARKPSSFL